MSPVAIAAIAGAVAGIIASICAFLTVVVPAGMRHRERMLAMQEEFKRSAEARADMLGRVNGMAVLQQETKRELDVMRTGALEVKRMVSEIARNTDLGHLLVTPDTDFRFDLPEQPRA